MWVLHKKDERPYFIVDEPIFVKKLVLNKGTKITYRSHFNKKGKQNKTLDENDIIEISFAKDEIIEWGGAPIKAIMSFNSLEKKGFFIYLDTDKIQKKEETNFLKIWREHSISLGILIENSNDWSFNKSNILDIESCGVNYQRFYEENTEQQMFLDRLFIELNNVNF